MSTITERLPAPRRRRQLLDVARTAFAERGFHQTSMNEVADAAGVTKPVLYQHFPSKRALYLELLDDVGARLIAAITGAVKDADGPGDQVRRGFEAYFEFVAIDHASFHLLFGGATRIDPEFAEALFRVEDAIGQVIADLIVVEGLDTERRLTLAMGLVGMAEATGRHWLATGAEGPSTALAEQVTDLAWRGLRGIRTDG